MNKPDYLVVPSCSGLLDCFNTKTTKYYSHDSLCCLQGETDTLLLLGLFSYIYLTDYTTEDIPHTIKMAEFKRYIGYTNGGKSKDLKAAILQLQTGSYLWENETKERVMEVTFNTTGTFLTIKSNYFTSTIKHMYSCSGYRDKWGRRLGKGHSTYSSLVHSNILTERNLGAVELTIELVKLIERRGPLSETGYAHISTMALVDRCPNLSKQVQAAKANKEKYRIFRNALNKSMELLRVKTSIFEAFENLQFSIPDKVVISSDCKINIKYSRRILNGKDF